MSFGQVGEVSLRLGGLPFREASISGVCLRR